MAGIPLKRSQEGTGMGKKVGAADNLSGFFLEVLIAKTRKAAKEHLVLSTPEIKRAHHFGYESVASRISLPGFSVPENKFSCTSCSCGARTLLLRSALASWGSVASAWGSHSPSPPPDLRWHQSLSCLPSTLPSSSAAHLPL